MLANLPQEIKYLLNDAEASLARAKTSFAQGYHYDAGKCVLSALEALRVASLHVDAAHEAGLLINILSEDT